MDNSQSKELYEYLQSELKKSDLEDFHEFAYSYASREISETNEVFLNMYITEMLRLFKMYRKENIMKISSRISRNVLIQNGKEFKGFEVELSDNERRMNEIQNIYLSDVPDFRNLERGIIELQDTIRKDRGKGRDNGITR